MLKTGVVVASVFLLEGKMMIVAGLVLILEGMYNLGGRLRHDI